MMNWEAICRFVVLLCLSFVGSAFALEPEEVPQLLQKAESLKTSNNAEFVSILKSLDTSPTKLSASQLLHVRYLQGWQAAYDGNYGAVVEILKPIINESKDATLRFRSHATMTNVLAISSQHEEAYSQLGNLIELLPQVRDKGAREQGLIVAAVLYNQARQYDLGLQYANMLIEESLVGRNACIGGQLKLEALHKGGKIKEVGSEFQSAIDACEKVHEYLYANLIRTYVAEMHLSQGRHNDAIRLLTDNLDEVKSTKYPMLISAFNALIAYCHRAKGDVVTARQFALRALESGVKGEYTRPLVSAYELLYEIAKDQGDTKAALTYYEQYSVADKGYLTDISARELAYQRVMHEVDAGKLLIDGLNKQNQVLQLQQELNKKAVENIRLYIALLVVIFIFIAFWAYKTKRSQMHFMKLSRRDGLTGIFNRPHFIELAESTLKSARKNQQDVCVVLCDLDHFKSVNDNYGHAEGDYVLQRAVTACQMHLRATDVFARIGGEEFGLLLPGCNIEDARGRVERLRIAVSESNPSDGKFKVSASFGISCSNSSGYNLQTLMTHADAALYQAKRSGRNRVVTYDAKDPAINSPRVVYVEGIRT